MFFLPVLTNPKKKYSLALLAQLGDQLNCANVLWGVGASAMLHQYGLGGMPNDIDIIVAEKDINKADKILSQLGCRQIVEKSAIYATEHFYEYSLPEIDIDLISGYKIILPNGATYSYLFDDKSVSVHNKINEVCIPFTSLEDWYVLYQLMPNREHKVLLIESYFLEKGMQCPDLLKRMIEQPDTPPSVIYRVHSLLSTAKIII